MIRRAAMLALLPLMLSACGGETNGEVIARYTQQVEAVRAELKGLAAKLPPPGTAVSGKLADVSPKPVYDVANGAFNTAIIAVETLNDEKPAFDLLLSSELGYALAWTGTKNPMAESALGEAAEGFAPQFETALGTPIVVLYRTVAYDPPRAVDEKTFDGGTAKIEAFVFTRADGKQVAACSVEAASSQNVTYSYKKGDDPKERLENFANSTLWQDAQAILSQCLGETTGGNFTFKRN
jgi:hypothetical protein